MASKLLIDGHPLMVMPKLATAIGLNEAIVLQQIHYWVEKYREVKDEHHKQDGQWWVWNTGSEWQENFPFWSERTVWRVIESLRKPHEATETDKRITRKALIVTGRYNQKGYDKTLWYRIDYAELERIEKAYCQVVNMALTDCHDGIDKMATPIPETTSETTSEKFTPSGEKSPEPQPEPVDDLGFKTPSQAQPKPKDQRLQEMRDAVGGDVLDGAMLAIQNASDKPMSMPADAGGADPWDEPADLFCCLHGMRLASLTKKKQAQWAREIRRIAEEAQLTPNQIGAAIRILPDTELAFKVPGYTTPYKRSFADDVVMVAMKIETGQIVPKGQQSKSWSKSL